MDGEFISTGQAAKICAVTPDTVLKWIKGGRLNARRTPGGHYRIDRRDLQELQEASEQGPTDSTVAAGTKNLVIFTRGGAEGIALCGAEFPPCVRLEIVESGYELSALVESFKPDCAIIDATVGMDRARDLARNLRDDPRLRVGRVLLATEPGRVAEERDRDLFTHIEIPITRDKFEKALKPTN